MGARLFNARWFGPGTRPPARLYPAPPSADVVWNRPDSSAFETLLRPYQRQMLDLMFKEFKMGVWM